MTQGKKSTKPTKNPLMLSIVGLLVINLVVGVFGLINVKMQLQNQQATQLGGAENYDLRLEMVTDEYYQDSTKSSLEQQLAAMEQMKTQTQTQTQEQTQTTETTPTTETAGPEVVELSKETLDAVEETLKNSYIEGNEKSDIVVLEYSELLCPYCKRQHNERTLLDAVEKYGVAASFQHMIVHGEQALMFSMGAECAGQQDGGEAFYSYIHEVFNTEQLTSETMSDIAKTLGLNEDKFNACLEDEDLRAKINAQTTQGQQLFGVNATPRSIVINKKTGKMISIRGAQPGSNFDIAIQTLSEE